MKKQFIRFNLAALVLVTVFGCNLGGSAIIGGDPAEPIVAKEPWWSSNCDSFGWYKSKMRLQAESTPPVSGCTAPVRALAHVQVDYNGKLNVYLQEIATGVYPRVERLVYEKVYQAGNVEFECSEPAAGTDGYGIAECEAKGDLKVWPYGQKVNMDTIRMRELVLSHPDCAATAYYLRETDWSKLECGTNLETDGSNVSLTVYQDGVRWPILYVER